MNNQFKFRRRDLYCEDVKVSAIARKVGTPAYIYSSRQIRENYLSFDRAFSAYPHITCYAMKTNSSLAFSSILARLGAGADIVSGGELFKALRAGFEPGRIVFAGVGKTEEEIRAALRAPILLLNVESFPELEVISRIACNMGRRAPVSFRINPNIRVQTHSHMATGHSDSKFGISYKQAVSFYRKASRMKGIDLKGIHIHIGSQITQIRPFAMALSRIISLLDELAENGIHLEYLDFGGGLGINYRDENPPSPTELARTLIRILSGRKLRLILEPGRYIAANSGILVAKALYSKQIEKKNYLIVDAGMNDLTRPTLYDAYHGILPVSRLSGRQRVFDVVGPICETGDVLGKRRLLPDMERGQLVAIMNCGAYVYSMASNYNSRPRAPEVLVKGSTFQIIRKRETYHDLIRGEKIP